METKRITCPETGHLEEVDLERTPSGLVVVGCSRFEPRCAPSCPRECARRMDRRAQRDAAIRERVLVLCPHDDGRTIAIAHLIAGHLRHDELVVDLADTSAGDVPPLAGYDAVVIGSPVRFGRPERAITRYIRAHRDELATMPAFFFSASEAEKARDLERYVARMLAATRWQPTGTATFGAILDAPTDIQDFAFAIGDKIPAHAGARVRSQR